ncbi:hypothetical protein RB623_28820 [Mesorhizobium sp. LHD-90]|uniref:hypothetical protein n=1 Tax=Mesorhizobium sp. LHD-90 TaxID=3071414 RepID=UPI0027DFE1AA|nr:hypothetical protein [Mesorhizobium sp. LHD-90]MDQ6438075.1 hypothetical protein [Mesorhizobium sp. LHD-90]
MSQELSLAQNHAWNLARTLMTPIILFKVDEEAYGVLPADDLDDDEVLAPSRKRPQNQRLVVSSSDGQKPSGRPG